MHLRIYILKNQFAANVTQLLWNTSAPTSRYRRVTSAIKMKFHYSLNLKYRSLVLAATYGGPFPLRHFNWGKCIALSFNQIHLGRMPSLIPVLPNLVQFNTVSPGLLPTNWVAICARRPQNSRINFARQIGYSERMKAGKMKIWSLMFFLRAFKLLILR
jgi:hypothetical protein